MSAGNRDVAAELRVLLDWGRRRKNDDFRKGHDSGPTVDVYRDGRFLAHVRPVGEREVAMWQTVTAISGFGADEVRVMYDTFFLAATPDEAESLDWKPGLLERMFHSPDPAERSLVSEALFLLRAVRAPVVAAVETCFAPYTYDARRNKVSWRGIKTGGAVDGFIADSITDAFCIAKVVSDDERFDADVDTIKALISASALVMYSAESAEQRQRLRDAIGKSGVAFLPDEMIGG